MHHILKKPAAGLVALGLLAGAAAHAQVAPAPAPLQAPVQATVQAPAPLSAMVAKVEAAGFRVYEAELDDGLLELDAIRADGSRVDLVVDPASGKILREVQKN